jgi:hypothetical protein
MRVCSRCGQEKPETEYYGCQWTKKMASGKVKVYKGRVQPCKRCKNARSQNARKKAISILGGKCMNCGETDLRVLQVNHLNGGGSKENSKRGARAVWADVIKGNREDVDVRCANCNILYDYERGIKTDHQDIILN